jgi:hypothetical protein
MSAPQFAPKAHECWVIWTRCKKEKINKSLISFLLKRLFHWGYIVIFLFVENVHNINLAPNK